MDKYIEPDFNHAALITIDMQNDFVLPGAVSQVPGTDKILPNMTKLLSLARCKNLTIVHVIRLYSADGSDADICRKNIIESGRKIACPETHGAEIVSELKPNSTFLDYANLQKGHMQEISKNEWVIYKSRWGAFFKTNLEKFLSIRGIDTLIFSGCNFPNCPRTSIYEASERDFKIVLVMDAISQIYPKGLEEMDGIGVSLLATEEIEKQLINK